MAGTVTTDILNIDNCDASLASWTMGSGYWLTKRRGDD